MKNTYTLTLLGVFAVFFVLIICSRKESSVWGSFNNPDIEKLLKQFVMQKEAQAKAATHEMSPEIQALFNDAKSGNWLALSNSFRRLDTGKRHFRSGPVPPEGLWTKVGNFVSELKVKLGWHGVTGVERIRIHGIPWEAMNEVFGAFDAFVNGDEKYSAAFGRDIIASMPMGSIYFGGTDPGRYIVTAMGKSQPDGEPVFTLTQNTLADGNYLDYLRSMYGDKIYIPSHTDVQTVFQDYQAEFKARLNSPTPKTGMISVIEIGAALAKITFDKNPDREIFIGESILFDWMYPYLEPHGLIMKINRQPLAELSEEIVKQDRDFWTKNVTPMIGDWLHDETPISEIAAFAEKTYRNVDLNRFKADPEFIQSPRTQKMFAKLRSSIGGIYFWRMKQATDASEKLRMAAAADFAFRQAIALCPCSLEVVFRYIDFLVGQERFADALVVVKTTASMPGVMEDELHILNDVVKKLEEAAKLKRL